MDREEAKEEARCSIAYRTGTGDPFSGLGAASRAGSPSRSVSWAGSDDILELKSEMGASRIARKELHRWSSQLQPVSLELESVNMSCSGTSNSNNFYFMYALSLSS